MSDIHSLTSEYAVGSLSDEETQQFETHLETCPDCREEVAEMQDIAVQLSEGVATDPPPTLRASVLQQIAQTPQDRPAPIRPRVVASGEPAGGRHVADGTGSSDAGFSNVVPLQRSPQRRDRLIGLLAAAAAVVAIAMGGWAVQSRNDAHDATAQAQQLSSLLTAKDVRTASADFGTAGNGTVVVSRSQRQAVLVAADLPALPSGKVYEAWTIGQSPTPQPAGTFTAKSAPAVVKLPVAAVTADQVAVTVEPSGGSQQPTTDAVFAVKLPHA